MNKKVLLLFPILFLISNGFATVVSNCGTVTVGGYYEFNQSMTSNDTCIVINTNDVIIDGKGYNITYGLTNNFENAIEINWGFRNITIKNLIIEQNLTATTVYSGGIYNAGSNFDLNFENVNITTYANQSSGIDVYDADGVNISNCNIFVNSSNAVGGWNIRVSQDAYNINIENNNLIVYNSINQSDFQVSPLTIADDSENVTVKNNNLTIMGSCQHCSLVYVLRSENSNILFENNYLHNYVSDSRNSIIFAENNSHIDFLNNTVMTISQNKNCIETTDTSNVNVSYNTFYRTQNGGGVSINSNTNNISNVYVGFNLINLTYPTNSWSSLYFGSSNLVTDYDNTNIIIEDNELINYGNDVFVYGWEANTPFDLITFKNQIIKKYSISHSYTKISVENTTYGKIVFGNNTNGSGNDLVGSGDSVIVFGNNSVYVNSTLASQFDTPSTVSIYGLSDFGFVIPQIYKDGVFCSDCVNHTSLSADTVVFSVTGFSEYEIVDVCGDSVCSSVYGEDCNSCVSDCGCGDGSVCSLNGGVYQCFSRLSGGVGEDLGNDIAGFFRAMLPVIMVIIIALGVVGGVVLLFKGKGLFGSLK